MMPMASMSLNSALAAAICQEVDTGAEVSVVPATSLDMRTAQPGPSLLAANDSSIKTYGSCTLPLHFTSNKYQWTFTIADVSRSLLGADLLCSNSPS